MMLGGLQGALTVSKRHVWMWSQPSVVPSHCKTFRDPPDTYADLSDDRIPGRDSMHFGGGEVKPGLHPVASAKKDSDIV